MPDPTDPGLVRIFTCSPGEQAAADLERAWAILDAEERAQATRFHFERDRTIYLVAHGMLREVLAAVAGVAPGALRFERGPQGRPELVPEQRPAGLSFNLAHTRELVGCAVTTLGTVGLDIEELRDPAPFEVAERFAPAEQAGLQALPPEARTDRFFVLWTLKEAYLKGCGLGLSFPLDEFAMTPAPDGAARLALAAPVDDPARWAFRWWRLPAHRMALAVRSDGAALQVTRAAPARILDLPGLVG